MPNWPIKDDCLCNSWSFSTVKEAFDFVERIYKLSEKQNHHAKIIWEYKRVEIFLTTHDKGNIITSRDYKLAHAIEEDLKN